MIEVHGGDEEGADDNLLPIWLYVKNDEAVSQGGWDEKANNRPKDCAETAEEARAADYHARDHVQIGQTVTCDGRRTEECQVK